MYRIWKFIKETLFGSLWHRLTNFCIIGLILVAVSFTLGATNWPKEGLSIYFTSFAVILFIGSVIIEGYGIYKTRHFYKEDALAVYQKVEQSIMELRTLAITLHKDYDNTTEEHRRYTRDKRYRKLINEFGKALLKCNDYRLNRKLSNLIENEKLMAKYRLNAAGCKFQGTLENTGQDIKNYIRIKFRTREALPKE